MLGYKGAKRGIHWIPKGTTVLELLERSLPAAVLAKKPIDVLQKGVEPESLLIEADQASRQLLENGDVIRKYGY